MHAGQEYKDLQHVKHEVSASTLSLLHDGVPANLKVGMYVFSGTLSKLEVHSLEGFLVNSGTSL